MYDIPYNNDVTRHWKSFDKRITDKEFQSLAIDDRIGLFEAMKLFALDASIGYTVKNYGEGLMMVKPKDGQGRCLFFTQIEKAGQLELIALLAYKKEGQKLPISVRRTAFARKKSYLENQP